MVERYLFYETKIDLQEKGVVINAKEPFDILHYITIVSIDKKVIRFNPRRIEGDVDSFIKKAKSIQKESSNDEAKHK